MFRKFLLCLSLMALAACSSTGGPSGGGKCPAPITGTMRLYEDAGYLPMIAVNFGDKTDQPTLLDTGGWWGIVDPTIAAGLQPHGMRGISGVGVDGRMNQYVTIPRVTIGRFYIDKADFLLASRSYGVGFHGTIGGNILKVANLEIDPIEMIVRLHDQFSCVERVDWPHSDVTVLPFELDDQNHIVVPATLDGHRMSAIIDTGAARSTLSNAAALHDFSLTESSSNVIPVGKVTGAGAGQVSAYQAQMHTLEFGSIKINNPRINFFPSSKQGAGMPDLIIGMHELHAMHMYIVFSEQKIYMTSAEGDLIAREAAGENTLKLRDSAAEIWFTDFIQDLGRALAADELSAARDVVAKSIDTVPSQRRAADLAERYMLLGKFDDALREIDAAEALHAPHELVMTLRGWVAYDEGKFAAARDDFDAALKHGENPMLELDADSLYGRGLSRVALADKNGDADVASARAMKKNVEIVAALSYRPLTEESVAAFAKMSKAATAGPPPTAGN